MGPFSALGLVLVACVAKVSRITGITKYYEEIASRDVENAMAAMESGIDSEEFGAILEQDDIWDQGEAIAREEVSP